MRQPSEWASTGSSESARTLAQARAAELRGSCAQAAALFAEAGRLDEASRVMLIRGDGEADPAARLRHYVQAVATAPEGGEARTQAQRKHALLVAGHGDGRLDDAFRRRRISSTRRRISRPSASTRRPPRPMRAPGTSRGRRGRSRGPETWTARRPPRHTARTRTAKPWPPRGARGACGPVASGPAARGRRHGARRRATTAVRERGRRHRGASRRPGDVMRIEIERSVG